MRLEKYRAGDAGLYRLLVRDEEAMRMNLGRAFTREEADMAFRAACEQNAAEPLLGWYKAYVGQEYVGLGAAVWNGEYGAVEIEYMLLPRLWGRGYGTALAGLLLERASAARPGAEAVAVTDPGNVASRRVLEKNGFLPLREELNEEGEPVLLYRRPL